MGHAQPRHGTCTRIGRWMTTLAIMGALPALTDTAHAEQPTCRVTSISLNAIAPKFDGNWQGITTASDGRCYFGMSTHSPSRGAGFFRFDPQTHQLDVLAEDLTYICGEDPEETPPQGKVHSPIVEHDGWLYFSTHLSNYWPDAQDDYTGAHVLGYELPTGEFRDFGVLRPRFSIYSAVGVDPDNDLLYALVVPFAEEDLENDGTYLYRIDISSGEKQDLGPVVERGRAAGFWFYIDDTGTCWFTLWRAPQRTEADSGHLYSVEADSDEIHRFDDVLPEGRYAPDGEPAPTEKRVNRSWAWVDALPGRERAVFTMGRTAGGDERLWLFDPSRDIESGEAFIPLGYIGSTFLGTARGGDRVYFVQYDDLERARNHSPEHLRDRDRDELDFHDALHLRSIAIDDAGSPGVIDHGRIVDQDGREARFIDSLAADDRGRVFMIGSWTIRSEDEGALQYVWEDQPFWPNLEPGEYHRMDRGEFFAYVDVSDDLEDDSH